MDPWITTSFWRPYTTITTPFLPAREEPSSVAFPFNRSATRRGRRWEGSGLRKRIPGGYHSGSGKAVSEKDTRWLWSIRRFTRRFAPMMGLDSQVSLCAGPRVRAVSEAECDVSVGRFATTGKGNSAGRVILPARGEEGLSRLEYSV